jgi:hypothetical protein
MKIVIYLTVLIGIVVAGFAVLDYFGYYIEWKFAYISAAALLPIFRALQSFFSDPRENINKIFKEIHKN